VRRSESRHDNMKGLVSLDTSPFCVFTRTAPNTARVAAFNGTGTLCLAILRTGG